MSDSFKTGFIKAAANKGISAADAENLFEVTKTAGPLGSLARFLGQNAAERSALGGLDSVKHDINQLSKLVGGVAGGLGGTAIGGTVLGDMAGAENPNSRSGAVGTLAGSLLGGGLGAFSGGRIAPQASEFLMNLAKHLHPEHYTEGYGAHTAGKAMEDMKGAFNAAKQEPTFGNMANAAKGAFGQLKGHVEDFKNNSGINDTLSSLKGRFGL